MGKPYGEHANFQTECFRCGGEVTVTKGRPEPHVCK